MNAPFASFARGARDYEWRGDPSSRLLADRVPALVGLAAPRALEGVMVLEDDGRWLVAQLARDGFDEHGRPKAKASLLRIERGDDYNAFEVALGVRSGVFRKMPGRALGRSVRNRLALGRPLSLAPEEASSGAMQAKRYSGFFCATTTGWSLEAPLRGLLLCGVEVPPDPLGETIDSLDDDTTQALVSCGAEQVEALLRFLRDGGSVPDLPVARRWIAAGKVRRPDELESARVLARAIATGELRGTTEDAEQLFDQLAPELTGGRDAGVAWLAGEDVLVPPPFEGLSAPVWRELAQVLDPVVLLEQLLVGQPEANDVANQLVDAIALRRLSPRALLPRRFRARNPEVCARLAELPGWEAWSPDERSRREWVSRCAERLGVRLLFIEQEVVIDVE